MYKNCSEAFSAAVAAPSRTFHARIVPTIGTYNPITEGVFSVTLTGGSNAGDALTLGSTVAATIEVELTPPAYALENREICLSMGLNTDSGIEYIPMGYFRPERPQKGKGKISFTAYDRMIYLAENAYSSNLTYPATDLQILQEMCDLMGVGLDLGEDAGEVLLCDESGCSLTDESSNPLALKFSGRLLLADEDGIQLVDEDGVALTLEFNLKKRLETHVVTQAPTGYSYREMIAVIAARHGKFACFDRKGNLTLRWWSNAGQIDFGRADEPEPGELDYTLGRITCAIDEETSISADYGAGTGRIDISDATMTQEELDALICEIGGFTYRSGEINLLLGDPRIDPWDMFVATWNGDTYRIPCMKLVHKFDGGLSTSIEASSESDAEQEYNYQGPSIKNISQTAKVSNDAVEGVKKNLASEILRATAAEDALSDSVKNLQSAVKEQQTAIDDVKTSVGNCAQKTELAFTVDAETRQATLSGDLQLILELGRLFLKRGDTKLQPCLVASPELHESGSAEIGEDGSITVDFPESVTAVGTPNPEYQIIVSRTSEDGGIDYVSKKSDAFIVYGSPGTTFDWMLSVQITEPEEE